MNIYIYTLFGVSGTNFKDYNLKLHQKFSLHDNQFQLKSFSNVNMAESQIYMLLFQRIYFNEYLPFQVQYRDLLTLN